MRSGAITYLQLPLYHLPLRYYPPQKVVFCVGEHSNALWNHSTQILSFYGRLYLSADDTHIVLPLLAAALTYFSSRSLVWYSVITPKIEDVKVLGTLKD